MAVIEGKECNGFGLGLMNLTGTKDRHLLCLHNVVTLRHCVTMCLAAYSTFDFEHEPSTSWTTNVIGMVNTVSPSHPIPGAVSSRARQTPRSRTRRW